MLLQLQGRDIFRETHRQGVGKSDRSRSMDVTTACFPCAIASKGKPPFNRSKRRPS